MIGTTGRNSRALHQIDARRRPRTGHAPSGGKLGAATMTAPRAAGILRARTGRGALAVTIGPLARSNE